MKRKSKRLYKKYQFGGLEHVEKLDALNPLLQKNYDEDFMDSSKEMRDNQQFDLGRKNIQSNLENVALKSGNPYAMAIGAVAKGGRMVSDGIDKAATNRFGESKSFGAGAGQVVGEALDPIGMMTSGFNNLDNKDLSTFDKAIGFTPIGAVLNKNKIAKAEKKKYLTEYGNEKSKEGYDRYKAAIAGGFDPKGNDFIQNYEHGGSLHKKMQGGVIGGSLENLSQDNIEVEGQDHEQGGVKLPSMGVELEGGETINKDFVFSEKLGFAQKHKPIAKAIGKIEKKPTDRFSENSLVRLKQREESLKDEQEQLKEELGIDNDGKPMKKYGGKLYKKLGGGGGIQDDKELAALNAKAEEFNKLRKKGDWSADSPMADSTRKYVSLAVDHINKNYGKDKKTVGDFDKSKVTYAPNKEKKSILALDTFKNGGSLYKKMVGGGEVFTNTAKGDKGSYKYDQGKWLWDRTGGSNFSEVTDPNGIAAIEKRLAGKFTPYVAPVDNSVASVASGNNLLDPMLAKRNAPDFNTEGIDFNYKTGTPSNIARGGVGDYTERNAETISPTLNTNGTTSRTNAANGKFGLEKVTGNIMPYADNILNYALNRQRAKEKLPDQALTSPINAVKYDLSAQRAEADNQRMAFNKGIDNNNLNVGTANANKAMGLFQTIRSKNLINEQESNLNAQEQARANAINKQIETGNNSISLANKMRKIQGRDDVRREDSANMANVVEKRGVYGRDEKANELVRDQMNFNLAATDIRTRYPYFKSNPELAKRQGINLDKMKIEYEESLEREKKLSGKRYGGSLYKRMK